jgi:hypothetical protein
MKILMKNMRIWRGGSPGSGSIGGGRVQAARWHARPGSVGRRGRRLGTRAPGGGGRQRPPGVLQAATRGAGGGGARSGGSARGRGWRGTGRWMQAATGGTVRVVRLVLVVNGPARRENREKLIFGGPLGFRWLVN